MGDSGRGNASAPKAAAGLKAVAFDLDGTLYPNYRFYARLFPLILRHPRFFRAFALVRRRLHEADADAPAGGTNGTNFYRRQAALMSELLGVRVDEQSMERRVYRPWENCFARVRLFPFVAETAAALKGAGLKLGLLSDFPPERKLILLGLEGVFDTVLCTEITGRLKPNRLPFDTLARAMAVEAESILYVGNSPRFDVAGAKAAGMRAALIKRGPASTGRCSAETAAADFVFRDYRQLRQYVLG
ncbi:MAG: HAD family hydrolase [Treponema sp.]|jgi:putative hydrolase of the HAD superfamily|nr:HAD family hydrolase [Treponema sp.]